MTPWAIYFFNCLGFSFLMLRMGKIITTLIRSLRPLTNEWSTVQACDARPWTKITGEGRIVGYLRPPEPQTSTSVLSGHHSSTRIYRRERQPGQMKPDHTTPHLTSPPPSLHLQPQYTFPRVHLCARVAPASPALVCSKALPLSNARSVFFLPVRPPS